MNSNFQSTYDYSVSEALPEERASFIRKTYAHLAGAILLFVLMETYLVSSGAGEAITRTMLGGSYSWLIVLGAFMGVSMLAQWWANSQTSKPLQYMGLLLYTVAEAIIFLPLLFFASARSNSAEIFGQAGIITVGLFAGLTAVVFFTKKDFSFLAPVLTIGFFLAFGFIIASILFGFNIGSLFAFLMVALAGGAILYNTSNVLHQYRPGQHVAASLSLFASIALLFWYVLQIVMGSSRR